MGRLRCSSLPRPTLALVLVGFVAFVGALPLACSFDGNGVDPAADGAVGPDAPTDSDGDVCVAEPACVDASTVRACDGTLTTCERGCVGAPAPHCQALTPGNGVDPGWLPGAVATLDVPSGQRWVFDTDTGEIFNCKTSQPVRPAGKGLVAAIRFETLPGAPGGAAIGAFTMTSLRIRGGGEVWTVGTNAFALLAGGEIRLEDRIRGGGGFESCSIAAACGKPVPGEDSRCAGPGGFAGGGANQPGTGPGGGGNKPGSSDPLVPELGGGGGAYGGKGGGGGGSDGAAGGVTYGGPELEPLVGGSGGGGGGEFGQYAGVGGGGGGALQLTSLTRIQIAAGGGIDAGGAGGGPSNASDGAGGGGGGAGGAILLEAPVLDLDGYVAANGGGGGGGNASGGSFGEQFGAYGTTDATPAAGGEGFYNGGNGGAGMLVDGTKGEPGSGTPDGTGGGGGGVGRIRLRTVAGGLKQAGGAKLTPTPTVALDLVR